MTTTPDNAPDTTTDSATADAPRRQLAPLLPGLLAFCLFSPLAVVNLEWHAYYQQLRLADGLDRSTLPLMTILYAKDLLLLLPALALALLIPAARRKTALAAIAGYVALLFFWLILDQQMYAVTGTHLTHFLAFAFSPNAGSYVGSTQDVILQVLRYFASLAQGVLVLILICAIVAWLLNRTVPPRAAKPLTVMLAGLYLLGIVAASPAQLTYPDVTNLRRLNDAMPVSLSFLAPGISFPDIHTFVDPFKARTRAAASVAQDKIFPGLPIDPDVRVSPPPGKGPPPNVIFLAVESFRAASLTPDVTPNLCRWARRGLRLNHHYAGGNFTQLGLFSLLYARPTAFYYQTLAFHIPPQATTAFRNSGYHCTHLCTVDHRGWCWMERYLNTDNAFDDLVFGPPGDGDWPKLDHNVLTRTHDLVTRSGGPPQFCFSFVISTHYPYKYPPEFLLHKPAWNRFDVDVLKMDPVKDRPLILNHYENAVSYLDHEIDLFLRSIDLTKNIVVITGDHGESFWDDGAIGHATRLSDAQTRVPCIILGPGIPSRDVDEPTTHCDILPTVLHAIAGRHVPIAHCLGADLLDPAHPAAPVILGTEGRLGEISMVLLGPHDRRLSVQFGKSRPSPDVLGSLDSAGRLNPFDVPPAAEAPAWADLVNHIITRLTTP